eukprot:7340311-Ditylum_brightwellii.AAC.1
MLITLSEIHNAWVTNNNITPSKIIVDEVDNSDNFLVEVIGLGLSLGSVLFEMFTGRYPHTRIMTTIHFHRYGRPHLNI